jgi:hypothetical protein
MSNRPATDSVKPPTCFGHVAHIYDQSANGRRQHGHWPAKPRTNAVNADGCGSVTIALYAKGLGGAMSVCDAAHRTAENLDRRLGDMLVVVRRASLPAILQLPGFVRARLNARPSLDAREIAEFTEAAIWPRSSAKKDRIVKLGICGRDVLQMSVNDAVHRPVKRLADLHSATKQPSPT